MRYYTLCLIRLVLRAVPTYPYLKIYQNLHYTQYGVSRVSTAECVVLEHLRRINPLSLCHSMYACSMYRAKLFDRQRTITNWINSKPKSIPTGSRHYGKPFQGCTDDLPYLVQCMYIAQSQPTHLTVEKNAQKDPHNTQLATARLINPYYRLVWARSAFCRVAYRMISHGKNQCLIEGSKTRLMGKDLAVDDQKISGTSHTIYKSRS